MMGRPEAVIDWDEVDQLLEAGCSGAEIAASIGMSADGFYDRCQADHGILFSLYSQQKRSKGDSMLRKVQFDAAIKDKDRAMLIWLGKQRLGQTDKSQVDQNVKGNVSIIVNPLEGCEPIQ